MSTTLKELYKKIHALEYLSLNALKMLGTGQRFQLSRTEFVAKLKAIAEVGVKTEYNIDNVSRYRSDMIKVLKKRKKVILDFPRWANNPQSDALVFVRIPTCICIEETDTQTGIPTIVFYYGIPEDSRNNIFILLIGIREFTGRYLTEPDRPYTRTTGSEAFQILVGSQKDLSSHEMYETMVAALKQKGQIQEQSFNALSVINIVDYSIKGQEPWLVGNIIFMVRDRSL